MAVESGGKTIERNSILPEDVHIFDFRYAPGETQLTLQQSITNEIVKYLGNPAYSTVSGKASGKTKTENNRKDENRSAASVVNIQHRVLDIDKNKGKVLQTALNKCNISVLLDDGSVLRASCSCNSSEQEVSNDTKVFFKSEPAQSSNAFVNEQPFQVDSDEAYARSLQRTINTLNDTVNILAGRRSFIGRSPMHQSMMVNGIPSFQSSQLMTNQRELLSATSIVLNTPIHRLSPTLRSNRYLPYNRDHRQNRRHIQMRHLLDISPAPRTAMMYSTSDEDMALPSLGILASPLLDAMSENDQQSDASTDIEIENYRNNINSPVNINIQLNEAFQSPSSELEAGSSQDSSDQSTQQRRAYNFSAANPSIPSMIVQSDLNSNSNDSIDLDSFHTVNVEEPANDHSQDVRKSEISYKGKQQQRQQQNVTSEGLEESVSKKEEYGWVAEIGQLKTNGLVVC